ncbi:MAG: hypothetical protein BWY02_02689 [bacterium ADurb.Bin157]|jgi:hypothetical protein|nr:MAG: hypothetical protein BWY02_02689 [bacterium ADurb.Bin157]
MTDLIKGHELLERWNIDIFKLYDYINKGLQPLNQTGKPIPPPNVTHMLKLLRAIKGELQVMQRIEKLNKEAGEETDDINKLLTIRLREANRLEEKLNAIEDKTSWLNFKIPKDKLSDEDYYENYYKVLDDHFSKDDVEKIEKNNPNILKDFSKKALKTFHKNRTESAKETTQQQEAIKEKFIRDAWIRLIKDKREKFRTMSQNNIAKEIYDYVFPLLKIKKTETKKHVLTRSVDRDGNPILRGLSLDTIIDIMKKQTDFEFNPFLKKF